MDGKPLSGVTILLDHKATGANSACLIDENGAFAFQAPIKVGTYSVALGPGVSTHKAGDSGPPVIPQFDTSVLEKYMRHATSGLTLDVTEGDNTQNFELNSGD